MQPLSVITFLIIFPFVLALLSLVARPFSVRRAVAAPANALIVAGSVVLLVVSGDNPLFFTVESPLVEHAILAAEIGLGLLIAYLGLSSRRYLIMLLGLVMTFITFISEVIYPPAAHTVHHLFIDRLSVIMALVIGILGTLIANYAAILFENSLPLKLGFPSQNEISFS